MVLEKVPGVFEEFQGPSERGSCMILDVFQGFFRGILEEVPGVVEEV